MSSIGFYENNARDFFDRSVGADMAAGYETFLARLPPGGRILDAGCGSGRDTLAFHRLGHRVTATEASPRLAQLARAHTGLPVRVLTFDQIAWREAFDGVWACASLLHVSRAALPDAVSRLRDALVHGGILWMSFKYGTLERDHDGRRFTDMDEALARDLVARTGGLDLLEITDSDDVRPERAGDRWLSILCQRAGDTPENTVR